MFVYCFVAFCDNFKELPLTLTAENIVPSDVDVVITVTTSATPVYTDMAQNKRLVIGVGVFQPEEAEIADHIVRNSIVFVDDMESSLHEAEDIIQAKIS